MHYNGRQLSDILEGTFNRNGKEALSVKRERRYYDWLPVIAWMIVIFILSAQPADQSIVLSGSVTRFFADVLNQLSAFIEYFTRAQGTVVFMAGILLLIYLLETQEDEPKLFGIKKRWIIGGTAIFLVLAIGLFLFVDFVQDTSIDLRRQIDAEIRSLHRLSDPRFSGFACDEERSLHRVRLETKRRQLVALCGVRHQ